MKKYVLDFVDKNSLACIADDFELDDVGTKDTLKRLITNHLNYDLASDIIEPTEDVYQKQNSIDEDKSHQRSKVENSKELHSVVNTVNRWIPRRSYPNGECHSADLTCHRREYDYVGV